MYKVKQVRFAGGLLKKREWPGLWYAELEFRFEKFKSFIDWLAFASFSTSWLSFQLRRSVMEIGQMECRWFVAR